MTPLFKKLNLGEHRTLLVVAAPESFAAELAALRDVEIQREPAALTAITYALVFVQTQADVDACAGWLPRAVGDAIIWFAYPKLSSKRYCASINRDSGWDALGAAGFEPVRQVAIDADWSALRFRRVEHIRTMQRDASMAISEAGKQRSRKTK